MRIIDLCCGIGGIRKGFELVGGFENVVSAEIDSYACKTYEHIFAENPRNDVASEEFKSKLKEEEYDVLLAGFPCQSFSKVGLRKGFKDKTKGTVFFDIANIIEQTIPKVVFLENVENLVSHDEGNTFRIIIETLEKELNYHVIGVKHDSNGEISYDKKSFIRNTKNFGLPQNRPRVYIVAFSREYYGNYTELLPTHIPDKGNKQIFDSVTDILDKNVDGKYFLSSGYLETLEKHKVRQKANGNGFGYRIVNALGITRPIASTILATGGSGKERNLVYDPINGKKYAGKKIGNKKTPINNKCIRMMTPMEWGRLQGFVDYAFVDGAGTEHFSFPDKMSDQQKYKQLGNSVSIPVIEAMALFIKKCVDMMVKQFSEEETFIYGLYGKEFKRCKQLEKMLQGRTKKYILEKYYRIVKEFEETEEFRTHMVCETLGISPARACQLLNWMVKNGIMRKNSEGVYSFEDLKSLRRVM